MTKGGKKVKITLGGWYQRTTLHLSEVYDLLSAGTSRLALDSGELKRLHKALKIKAVTRESANLEFVRAKIVGGIEIKYYEDGLYTLELSATDIPKAESQLKTYYDSALAPAIAYIFSLGAPTPKVLANIPSSHPVAVTMFSKEPEAYVPDSIFGHVYQRISSDNFSVYKTEQYIVVVALPGQEERATRLIENQIFFREFKDQLGKYLSIHRTIWEKIADIKERKQVKARELSSIRNELDGYQSSIDLIGNRINQMGVYVHMRESIARNSGLEGELVSLFEYRFESLLDTWEYIKEIWKMTSDYLQNSIKVIVELQGKATQSSINSLRAVTTFGVIANMVGFLSKVPTASAFTPYNVAVLSSFLLVAWLIDRLMRKLAENSTYKLKFSENSKDI